MKLIHYTLNTGNIVTAIRPINKEFTDFIDDVSRYRLESYRGTDGFFIQQPFWGKGHVLSFYIDNNYCKFGIHQDKVMLSTSHLLWKNNLDEMWPEIKDQYISLVRDLDIIGISHPALRPAQIPVLITFVNPCAEIDGAPWLKGSLEDLGFTVLDKLPTLIIE